MREEVLNLIIEKGAYIWGKDVSELSENTTFDEMNAKSAHLTSIIVVLENEFDAMINYIDFKKCKTLGEAADYVVDCMED